MPTLKEVAEAAGVSTVTASSVLSGAGRVRVSTATAARIRETARTMNYVPRAAARGLRTGKTEAIGFVASARHQSRWQAHWQEALRGVSDLLWDREERLILVMPRSSEHEMEALRQLAFGHQVDGLILQNVEPGDPRVAMLEEADVPFVALGGEGDGRCHAVAFDTERFSELVARRLLERAGALGVIAARRRSRESMRFLDGFRRTAESSGRPIFEWSGAFLPAPETLSEARGRAGDRPLGVCLLRQLLPEFLAAIARADLRLEEDVLVTYLAGAEEIVITPPGLDVIPLDYYTLGRRAAKALFGLIERGDGAAPRRTLVLPGMAEFFAADGD